MAIPGRIVLPPSEHFAEVEVSGVRRQINIDLIAHEGAAVGDWVLIHVGFALNKISPEEARKQIELLTLLGEAAEVEREVSGYGFSSGKGNDQA